MRRVCIRRLCVPVRSVTVIEPLLTDELRAHPAWLSWLKLVELFTLTIQHELSLDDIHRLDDLQIEHTQLFRAVPEYSHLVRPKHHYQTHLPLDAWLWGPPRGFWCFGFEAYNRIIKRGATRSNWMCECESIMRYSILWSARNLVAPPRSDLYEAVVQSVETLEVDEIYLEHDPKRMELMYHSYC
jgi:hypothetical protein